jgi:RHS repeat-associated protein
MGTVRYTVLDGEIVSENRNGTERDYVPDPLGSTVALLDSSQAQTDTLGYWPYGEERARTGTTPTAFRFLGSLGYYRDAALATYVRAREMSVGAGRWMTPDAARWVVLDRYSYGQDNPESYLDPEGTRPRSSGPLYDPGSWDRGGVIDTNNCYSYGCDRRSSRPPWWPPSVPWKPQPGGWPVTNLNPCSCRSVMDAIERDGSMFPRPRGRRCPPGTFTVIMFVKTSPPDECDYHFIRRDRNGLWSDKCGATPVGPQTSDPYGRARDEGYDTVCEHYCAPVR